MPWRLGHLALALSPVFNLLDIAYVQRFLEHCSGLFGEVPCTTFTYTWKNLSDSVQHHETLHWRFPGVGIQCDAVQQGSYTGGRTNHTTYFAVACDDHESLAIAVSTQCQGAMTSTVITGLSEASPCYHIQHVTTKA